MTKSWRILYQPFGYWYMSMAGIRSITWWVWIPWRMDSPSKITVWHRSLLNPRDGALGEICTHGLCLCRSRLWLSEIRFKNSSGQVQVPSSIEIIVDRKKTLTYFPKGFLFVAAAVVKRWHISTPIEAYRLFTCISCAWSDDAWMLSTKWCSSTAVRKSGWHSSPERMDSPNW